MDTTQVTYAVAQILHDASVGVWRPTGPAYTAAEAAIYYGLIGASPDKALGVTVYAATDNPENGRADRFVQVRSRGPRGVPNGADVLADAAFAALHCVYRIAGIARITRTSTAPLGADENGRAERSDNYICIIDNEENQT